MANPKIVYDPGTGPTTLSFQRAPRLVPAYSLAADRHDNVATSGVRESIYLRTDAFLEFEMEWVASGSDVQAWSSFMNFALKGGSFSYYPDSSQTAFTNYWLEDTSWDAAYKVPGQYRFKLKFRQVTT
jgi:hypothetical protein